MGGFSGGASTGGGGGSGPAGRKTDGSYGTKRDAQKASRRNEARKAAKEIGDFIKGGGVTGAIVRGIKKAAKKSKQNVLDYEGQAAGVTPMRAPKFVPMGDDGNDNNGGAIESTGVVVQAPKVEAAPTEAEVSQVTTAEATPEVEPEEEIQAEPEEVVTEPITEPEEETTEVQA